VALRTDPAGEEVWPAASTSGVWPVLVAGGAESAVPAEPAGYAVSPGGVDGYAASPVVNGVPAAVAVLNAPPGPPVPRPREEPDGRDEVARAALGAYRRGGISVEQLRTILRLTSGWNHLHARHEREVLLRRAAEREAHRRYNAATAAERGAYLAVDVATAAARAWADEAAAAAEEARLAQVFATRCLRRAATRRRVRRLGPRDGASAPVPG
jgi:hypothetical protein